MKYLLVFVVMVATDFLWARYILWASQRRATAAALYSMGIFLTGSVATVIYVSDPTAIPAAVFGAGVGTFLGIRHER